MATCCLRRYGRSLSWDRRQCLISPALRPPHLYHATHLYGPQAERYRRVSLCRRLKTHLCEAASFHSSGRSGMRCFSRYKPFIPQAASNLHLQQCFSKHRTAQMYSDVRGNTTQTDDGIDESLLDDAKYQEYMREYFSIPDTGQQLFVIQPEIKWGPRKAVLTTAELQLAEACALVHSLPHWSVVDKMICRTRSLDTRLVFGTGMLAGLTRRVVERRDVSAVFLSINMLSGLQLASLQRQWGVPVYDRYTVVLEIFKEHAKSKEAKLQVALAEIPYIRTRLRGFHDGTISRSAGGMQHIGGSGETFLELRHRLLQERELKLRKALGAVKDQRQLLRKGRVKKEFPVVAVVGYTNAGKTSLIKALTGDSSMVPRDELFATLDVTTHAGYLPSRVPALFVDTVGFMSDIPTTLIDAFSATLEDALSADVIIHVRDVSHPDTAAQRHNVVTTLESLLPPGHLDRVIEVGNKADLLPHDAVSKEKGLLISATLGSGLRELMDIVESAALQATGKTLRRISVPMGGPHLSWLHSEATITKSEPTADSQHLVVDVIMSEATYAKFRAQFGRPKHKNR